MDYKKLMDMTGKVCIVTGGTGYLGTENVKILKDFGATVVVADIRAAEERWANAPQPVGDLFVECDVSASESIRACFQKVYDTYGHIDVLINCASYGAGYGKGSQLEYMEDDVFNKGVDGSLGVVFRGMREVVPFMKKTGGSIINYCSMYGIVSPDLRIYGDNPQKQRPTTVPARRASHRSRAMQLGLWRSTASVSTASPRARSRTREIRTTLHSTHSWLTRLCLVASARAMRSRARFCCWLPMRRAL